MQQSSSTPEYLSVARFVSLATPQRYPRAGSQSYPTPAAEPNADGSTTIYFAPTQPAGVKPGNWIQTVPGKGWSTLLRLYSPLEPFFTKAWRPSEIELAVTPPTRFAVKLNAGLPATTTDGDKLVIWSVTWKLKEFEMSVPVSPTVTE